MYYNVATEHYKLLTVYSIGYILCATYGLPMYYLYHTQFTVRVSVALFEDWGRDALFTILSGRRAKLITQSSHRSTVWS